MSFAAFGPGILMCTRTDISNPTPVNVGYAQELTLDVAGNTKQLFGQNQYPLVSARSTIKATGKFKSAMISGLAWNTLFFGQSLQSGGESFVPAEAGTIPAPSGPYTITVSGSATWTVDLGVMDVTSGLPMKRVSSGPATGEYSVSAGVYTFAAADANKAVLISYAKTVTTGQSLTVANTPIGQTPTFRLDYYTSLNQPTAKPFYVSIYACIADKVSLPFKLEDFAMPEFDFSFFALANGNVMKYNYPDVG